jgi:hypothetical protein
MDAINVQAGFDGEKVLRDYLVKMKYQFGQVDVISKINDKWYLFEVKHQEKFEAPPFDGHGLPPWQVKFRIQAYNELGIIPILFVVDKTTGICYYQNLMKLEKGLKHTTSTGKRVIYPLESFEILDVTKTDELKQ